MMASSMARAARLSVVLCLAVTGMALAGGAAPAGAQIVAVPAPVTVTFADTGTQQEWDVPAGVTSIEVVARGAAGAPEGDYQGKGAVVSSTVAVDPEETLTILVGGMPNLSSDGGWNGGAPANEIGTGGGGATDLRRGPAELGDRVVVAGGGGGSTLAGAGGDGGEIGSDGGGTTPGEGGTQRSGGAGGSHPSLGSGQDGSLGAGGAGNLGAGGGGGYYGGGGGAVGGAGGGGSSVGPDGTVYEAGTNEATGQLTITYTPAPVKLASRMVWLSTANPSKSGGTILYARVMPVVPGGPVPTGTVTFSDGDGRTFEATLNAYGQAVWYDTALRVGTYTVGATYNGSDTYDGSAAANRTQTVEPAPTAVTWLSTVATPNPSVTGSTVLYARVNPVAPGRGTVTTGSIRFTDGERTYDALVNAYGQAVWYDTALGAGEHTVTATYLGSTDYAASPAAARTQTVDKADTTTVIQTQARNNGDTIVYATVRAASPGRGIPTGTVTFTDATGTTTDATLSQYGVAYVVFVASRPPIVRVDYRGDDDYAVSFSTFP